MQINSSIWLSALVVIFFVKTAESDSSDSDEIEVNYRLPNETYPEHYDINLTTNVHAGEKSFQGEVIIDIVVAKDTNSIVLYAREQTISKVAIANPSSGDSEELAIDYEPEREFLIFTRETNESFAAETKWKLTITYSGKLRDDKHGFYLSKYRHYSGNIHYLAATNFENIGARYAFPCYDEPGKRANFTITINHSPSHTAISNMPVNEALSSAGKTVFLTTARIPTYIVGFVISDLEYSEIISNGIVHRIYSRPEKKYGHIWALNSSVMIMEYLTDYFGTGFMLPKIDYVEVPDFDGTGKENWGLAIFKADHLISRYNYFDCFLYHNFEKIAAVLYQHWFGDFVPFKWWSDLWLKQGFTTFFGFRAMDHFYPEWNNWVRFHIHVYQRAFEDSSIPLNSYMRKPAEIDGVSSYSLRSSTVLIMWINALTENVFQKAFQNYLTKHKYSAFEDENLFSALQTAVEDENYKIPSTISTMIRTWIDQGGYPVLTVTRNYDDGTFTVKQEDATLKDTKTWYVPINYAVASDSDFRDTKATHYLLNVTETTFDDVKVSKNDWLILNKQSTGYYRINYDADNWNLIADALIENPFSFHYRNRAQFIDDASYFCDSNRMDPTIFLKLLTYLKQEDQFAPWWVAYEIFLKYEIYFRSDVTTYDDFKFFVSELIRPMYRKYGVNGLPVPDISDKLTQFMTIFIACQFGMQECVEATSIKLENHLLKNITMESYLLWPVYCGGLKQPSDEVFDRVYQELLDSEAGVVRDLLLYSLVYTADENQIKKLLNSTIDESFTLRDIGGVNFLVTIFSKSEASFFASVEFLNQNWEAYDKLYHVTWEVLRLAKYVVNKQQEEKLLDLAAKVKDLSYNLETKVKDQIADNFEWLKKYGEPMKAWLSQYRADNDNGGQASHSTRL